MGRGLIIASAAWLLFSVVSGASPRPTLGGRGAVLHLSGGQVDTIENPAPLEPASTTDASPSEATFTEKLVGELVGTFLLTLAVTCSVAQGLPAPAAPLAIASILIGLIYAFGPLSGAIFNPAVSVALCLRKRMTMDTAFAFAGAETLGALLAGLAGKFIYGKAIAPSPLAAPTEALVDGTAEKLVDGTEKLVEKLVSKVLWPQAGLAEVLFTGTIVQVVLHCATTKAQEDNHVVGVAIGLTVFGCAMCSTVSGSVFNPAIGVGLWLAKAIVREGFSWACALLYVLGPCLGAALSTGAFLAARPREP